MKKSYCRREAIKNEWLSFFNSKSGELIKKDKKEGKIKKVFNLANETLIHAIMLCAEENGRKAVTEYGYNDANEYCEWLYYRGDEVVRGDEKLAEMWVHMEKQAPQG